MSKNQLVGGDKYHAYPNEPAAGDFLRRANHASITLGQFVYLDGGEIAMMVDGTPTNMLNNDTLTLDMSTSWTNTTVTYASINKTTSSQDGVPDLNDGFLFPAADNESFFQFGGETNWLFNAWLSPSTAAYQFTLNGEGNGSWSVYNSGGDSGINNITRPTRALAATVDNTFFILGGIEDSHSAQSTMYAIEGSDSVTQGGVVAFNTTVGKWTNSSMPEHLVRPHGRNGMLGALPTFGPRGLLLAAGTGTVDGEAPSLENITLYEPGQKTWHYQTATGDIPKGRDGGCNVGIAGDDGTYEIYLYGGRNNPNGGDLLPNQVKENVDLDSVYVLSVPAFAWFRADYTANNTRYYHTCEVVGNRQMLSIGGRNPLDDGQGILSPDPIKHGLQVFDLTEMKWSDRYDADAAPYTTPQIVKDWYQKNTSPKPPPHYHHTPAGAIAGGVVGGLAFVSIVVAFLYWFLQQRRRRQAQRPYISSPNEDMKYAHSSSEDGRRFEADGKAMAWEADGKAMAWEADGRARMEMDDGKRDIRGPVEML
ncbi:MAG: hypothetical protein LQ352_004301 [Teloschistes flavicans]|nr:MAG: hypothetical protein LQ352_004301 [Teloschistes flavicans]